MLPFTRHTHQFIHSAKSYMKLPLLLPVAFLLLIVSSLHSQNEWRHLTTDDGLNSNKILSIYQAKNGDVWIGTDKGINQYNGIFEEGPFGGSVDRIIESPSGQIIARAVDINNVMGLSLFDGLEWDEPDFLDANDIRVSDMQEFAVASDGKLWIGTWNGLVSFDGTGWKLYDTDVDIDWLAKTPDGQLWSVNWRHGIVSFDGQKWNLEFNIDNSPIENTTTNTALVTSTRQILLGTDQGLFQYDPVLSTITGLRLGKVNVKLIYETNDQSLWVATDKGLFQLADGKWRQSIADQAINYIQQTNQGQLWVATSDGLYHFDNGKWISELGVAINYFTELTDGTVLAGGNDGLRVKPPTEELIEGKTYLSGNFISKLFLSSDGMMWSCSTAGIFSYNGVKWTQYGSQNPDVRLYPATTNIFEDSKGRLWFTFPFSRLQVFSDGKLETSESSLWRTRIIETSDGRIWTVGYGEPDIYDGNNGKEWVVVLGYGDPAPIDSWTYAVHEDDDGSILIGGEEGLWRLRNNQWSEFKNLESRRVLGGYDFIRAPDGTLWAAAKTGIHKLNAEDQWEQVRDGEIIQFHLTANNQLFAVEKDKGLLINQGQQWIEHPSYGSGRFYSDWYGHGFVEYPTGVFWLATNKGLRRIQGDSWYDLTLADGLPSNDVQTVELDRAGNLWIGTREGVTRFNPPKNPNPPAVQLVRIDGDEVPDNRIHITGQAFVTVDWRGGDIETDSSRLQFQYSIDGQWSEPLKQRTATIGLRNGEHKFSIRTVDHHFNTSAVDSMTIIIKTEAPILSIGNPDTGDVVSGEFYIKGRIEDDDLAAFQLFISDTKLTKIPILLDDSNLDLPYQLIFEADAKPRTATLAPLKTTDLDDGDYQIWLTAQDQLKHSSVFKVMIRTDNTPPAVKISTPTASQRVLKQVIISAVTGDFHLDSYRLDYTTDLAANEWWQIYVKGGLYQKDESGQLKPPDLKQVEIQQEWEVPIKEGQIWIRLLATDIAGNTNSQIIQVEVPAAVVTRKGGTISPQDQQAELYFPPNTLPQDTIVTVNALPKTEVETPVRRVSQIYDFAPITLRLSAIKPATLTISYDPSQLSAGKEPLIFHRTDGPWKAVGGTPNPEQQTIRWSGRDSDGEVVATGLYIL